ncbi:MAG TPA: DUF2059 domain-containing protein [Sphingomonadaceae bacterium]|nr:DUF2059 domain-containing protein [Sphingomonadaceae bacterium]
MSRRVLSAATAFALALMPLGGQALAADAPAAKPPAPPPLDPAAKSGAEELLKLMGFEKMMEDGMRGSLGAMRSGEVIGRQLDSNAQLRLERSKNPQAWDKALHKIGAMQADAAEEEIKATMPEIKAMAVELYARNFSAEDLQELTKLYHTPVGKKLLDELPKVMGNVMVFAQAMMTKRLAPRMRQLQPAIQAELEPLLPKKKEGR